MTRGIDNDEWLKKIGAVTVHDDDDRDNTFGAESGSRSSPPAADDEVHTDPKDLASAEFDDDGDESPLGYAEDDYDYDGSRPDLLLDSPFDVGGSVVDLDSTPTDADSRSQDPPPRRYTPWVLAAFGAAAVLGTIITLVVTMANSPSTEPSGPAAAPVAPRVVEVPPPSPPPNSDGPLPFTASSDCPPGSTSAQSVADPNSTTPWVCLRSVDGQVLEIDLGRTFVITAVSIVPGAVSKTAVSPDQPDPWLQHRVVTRVQWQFNDTDRTVKNQNTGNVRGEAVESIRPGVLASKITVIIQETSRPPAIAPTNTTAAPTPPSAGPSILGDILGGNQGGSASAPAPVLAGGTASRDPADGTFAVSSIKIIGHKAV
ncbi:hypothetical protein MGALJ_60500 (plasmid) [Mycobacterium gallinarum]|uniref:F5/8 type C domain-containing protein n=1 Tax=Mycobacterium gallinarum TaxID=39689 RepID=A0A9W4B970_9MYCO|nr:discoidin domain-containing protein [Mycobacterium gallinarum]BBY96381.1 hypothetical protein MGALJ_60500 [Mycobacterium gallinarum]